MCFSEQRRGREQVEGCDRIRLENGSVMGEEFYKYIIVEKIKNLTEMLVEKRKKCYNNQRYTSLKIEVGRLYIKRTYSM